MAGATTVVAGLLSVVYMPVPDALCVVFSCPALVLPLSAWLLAEPLTLLRTGAVTLLLAGVLLVCRDKAVTSMAAN